MAKLSDITPWIERMVNGDGPRARSLIQLGRKAKLFATGPRGPGAPDMGPRDAAYAVLLALYEGPPTECGDAANKLAALPLAEIEVFPDGPREANRIRLSRQDAMRCDIPLPRQLKACPSTLLDALIAMFASETAPYWLDSVAITAGRGGLEASVTIFDLERDVDSDLASERDFFQADMKFRRIAEATKKPLLGRASKFDFSGAELRDLHCLIHDRSPEDDTE